MDNSMIAIISILMIGLGALNGAVITALIDSEYIQRLELAVLTLSERNRELETNLTTAIEERERIVSDLQKLIGSTLPPPKTLERSPVCSETGSDVSFQGVNSPKQHMD